MKQMKIEIKIYRFITFLMLLDLALFGYLRISFRDTVIDRGLFWCWLVSTSYIIVRFRKLLWTKIYAGVLVFLLILAALPMGIPLIQLQHFALGKEASFRTKHFRIMTTSVSPLARPYISINRISGLFEREIAALDDEFVTDARLYRLENVIQIKEQTEGNKQQLVFIFKTDTFYHTLSTQ